MKLRHLVVPLLLAVLLSGCEKNTVSKIPYISLTASGPDSIRVNIDSAFIQFSLTDGDGDIGNDTVSVIHLKDSRYDTAGFVKTLFPAIDASIEDPKKGLAGTCLFYPQPTPRSDSVHLVNGDTLTYELYITDRANHESNHITTRRLIIRP